MEKIALRYVVSARVLSTSLGLTTAKDVPIRRVSDRTSPTNLKHTINSENLFHILLFIFYLILSLIIGFVNGGREFCD